MTMHRRALLTAAFAAGVAPFVPLPAAAAVRPRIVYGKLEKLEAPAVVKMVARWRAQELSMDALPPGTTYIHSRSETMLGPKRAGLRTMHMVTHREGERPGLYQTMVDLGWAVHTGGSVSPDAIVMGDQHRGAYPHVFAPIGYVPSYETYAYMLTDLGREQGDRYLEMSRDGSIFYIRVD